MTNSRGIKERRPPTVWYGSTTSSKPVEIHGGPVSSEQNNNEDSSITATAPKLALNHLARDYSLGQAGQDQDPWVIYDKVFGSEIRIFQGRDVMLARRRSNKMELVNIQELSMEPPQLESLVQTVNQYSGRNFLRLLDIYQQGNRCFLVWEPVELSLNEVLASRCAVTETGLAEIVWPVNPPYLPSVIVTFPVNVTNADYLQILKGIRYLRDHGRALASLEPTKILLTETGGVRIGN